jgi:DNA-binding transcriptional regulator LsrR (DeoR family)
MSKDTRNEEIVNMFNDGAKQKVIAEKYGVSVRTVRRIVNENTETQQISQNESGRPVDVSIKKKYSLIKDSTLIDESDDYLDFEDKLGKLSRGKLNFIEERLSQGMIPKISGYEIILNDISDTVEKTKEQLEQEIKDLKYVLNEIVGVLSDKDIMPHYMIQKIKDKL